LAYIWGKNERLNKETKQKPKTMLKKIGKIFTIILIILAVLFATVYLFQNEKLPIGNNPEKADHLANKMLTALNKPAWDSTNLAAWTFAGRHKYVWHKKYEMVSIKWADNLVYLNLKEWKKGKAFVNNKEIKDKDLDVLRGKAYAMFCNDSFWFIAPYKVFDDGVSRKIVKTEDQNDALLVTYSSGGVTPGDSYLWVLDENNVPLYFKMWVKILPIGGIKGTWENWLTTKTGAKIASTHKIGPINSAVTDMQTGQVLSDLNLKDSYFDLIK
jgi:hypothetical protein